MSDINEEIILELDRVIAEGKSSLVSRQISIEELEKELLSCRVEMAIGQTALDALVKKREELAQASPHSTSPEHAHPGSDHKERKPPQMPEGRTVENPAVDIQQDASERILNMFDQPDSAICYSVAQITEEVYGVSTPHNLKKCAMRLYDLQRKGKVVFNRPISAATTVECTCG